MTSDEIHEAIKDSMVEAYSELPQSMLAGEDAQEAYDDIVSRFVVKLAARGVYLVDQERFDRTRKG